MAPKRRASTPLSESDPDTDDLVSRILAPNPKPKKKRARCEEETKAALKVAKLETNSGLKAKMKGKGGSRAVSSSGSANALTDKVFRCRRLAPHQVQGKVPQLAE